MIFHNKFGMFIHWGVYALTGLQEQALARYQIPRAEYEALKDRFDPADYDPEQWVLLAKEAGMKYICFTAKHHDGFCMWDTKYTDYSVMHTPCGKDVLAMLADACAKHGMLLSLYYSNPDWHHPRGYNPASTHQWPAVNRDAPDFGVYKTYLKNQITELLTGYGPIYTLFWDIPPRVDDPSINEYVRSLQPGILINDRGFSPGDFSTPEREMHRDDAWGRYERMTEACNAVGMQSWGWRREEDFYSIRYLTCAVDKVMARGGSYLLNIGPRADGTLDPAHAERIRRVGRWYNRMGGCLEEHEADPFDYKIHKSGPCVVNRKGGRTYLHFFQGTSGTAVYLGAWPSVPKAVHLVNDGRPLPFAVTPLPDDVDTAGGVGRATEGLRISGVPIDDFPAEPIVIGIEW